jgi:hypothetical protein
MIQGTFNNTDWPWGHRKHHLQGSTPTCVQMRSAQPPAPVNIEIMFGKPYYLPWLSIQFLVLVFISSRVVVVYILTFYNDYDSNKLNTNKQNSLIFSKVQKISKFICNYSF